MRAATRIASTVVSARMTRDTSGSHHCAVPRNTPHRHRDRGRERHVRHDREHRRVVVEDDHQEVRDHHEHRHRAWWRAQVLRARDQRRGRRVERGEHHEADHEEHARTRAPDAPSPSSRSARCRWALSADDEQPAIDGDLRRTRAASCRAPCPASRARTGIVASRISTIRVCFSSTTLWAIVVPNVIADMKNTSPKPSAMKYVRSGFGAFGSSSSTCGDTLRAGDRGARERSGRR